MMGIYDLSSSHSCLESRIASDNANRLATATILSGETNVCFLQHTVSFVALDVMIVS